MNIFIYGSNDFKKDIHKILRDSKIEEILEGVEISDITTITDLKEHIASNPDNIYLIDEDKIIKNSKFNFLKPKDAIEEEFLHSCGIDDLQIESFEDIPNYIERRYDKYIKEQKKNREIKDEDLVLDSELSDLLESKNKDIQDKNTLESSVLSDNNDITNLDIDELDGLIEDTSSTNIQSQSEFAELQNFDEDVGLNNISFDYDDDSILNDNLKSDEDILSDILNLSSFEEDDEDLVEETFEDVNFLDEIFPNKITTVEELTQSKESLIENDTSSLEHLVQNIKLDNNEKIEHILDESEEKESKIEDNFLDESSDICEADDNYKINEIILDEKKDIESINNEKEEEGDFMSDEFFELDGLDEKDLIEALSSETANIPKDVPVNKQDEELNLSSSNVAEISSLISKLLNNKTLEITIKIKD